MNKRRIPLPLVAFVVVAVAGGVVFNALQHPQTPGEMQSQAEDVKEHKVTDAERQKAKEALRNSLAQPKSEEAARGDHQATATKDSEDERSMSLAKNPTVLLDEVKPFKPRPNDASTATHWYDKRSRSAQQSEANGRG